MPALATAKEWDAARTAFATSIMVDTSLSSLAQNLEGPDWPLKGKDETPAKYIDLSFDEVVELLALKAQPPERIDQLIAILKETLAFDDPFGEMVTQAEAAAERDNPLLRNLARLGIPGAFPVELAALSAGTLEFCRLEKLTTLEELAVFAQGMAQSVIVGGDFRTLLNALSHVDEAAIAQFLPFRPGAKGLHLIESVAQALRAAPADQRAALTRRGADAPAALQAALTARVRYFADDVKALRAQLAGGAELRRLVQVVGDPALEPAVVAALASTAGLEAAAPAATRGGLLGSLGRWFKK